MTEPTESRGGIADVIERLMKFVPARLRKGTAVVPVVAPPSGMLSGLLGRKSAGAGALASVEGIASLPDELISALETRAIWAKFGF